MSKAKDFLGMAREKRRKRTGSHWKKCLTPSGQPKQKTRRPSTEQKSSWTLFELKEDGPRRQEQGPERRRDDGHSDGIYHWDIRGEHCGYLHIVLVFRECQTEG